LDQPAVPGRAAGVPGELRLAPPLRAAVAGTAVVNLLVGVAFLFGPELGLTLWPSPISPVLMRFVGGIVLGNAAGAWLAARRGTWEGARVLFAVALVYGVVVLVFLLYHLLLLGASPVFWPYVLVDALFLGPIAYVYWSHEQRLAARG
jgi:hypothetical protein